MTKIRWCSGMSCCRLKRFIYLFVEAGGRCGKSLQVGDVMSNVVMGKVVTEPTVNRFRGRLSEIYPLFCYNPSARGQVWDAGRACCCISLLGDWKLSGVLFEVWSVVPGFFFY